MDRQKLIQTPDHKLLKEFPGYTRAELRQLKQMPGNILIFDIETAPIEVMTWGLFDQNMGINQIMNDWFMLCWSAKWLYEKKIHRAKVTPKEAVNKDDSRITEELWHMLDKADIVIAHNGFSFDVKKANARFLKHNLPKPGYFKILDTLKVAKKEFNLTSYKLDFICSYLGLNRKKDTGGFQLWVDCCKGDKKALDKMSRYCNNDVKILEEVYLELRPYIDNHPNLELYQEEEGACPNCGSHNYIEKGTYKTQKRVYTSYRCECGALFHKK